MVVKETFSRTSASGLFFWELGQKPTISDTDFD